MVGDDDSSPDGAEYDTVVLEPLVPLVVANVEVPVNIHSLLLNISFSHRCLFNVRFEVKTHFYTAIMQQPSRYNVTDTTFNLWFLNTTFLITVLMPLVTICI